MAKKKQAGNDEPFILGKWLKDIRVIDEPPEFLIGLDKAGKPAKFPAAPAIKLMKLTQGMCLIGIHENEPVRYYPMGMPTKKRRS